MFRGMANSVDPDQTSPSGAVWSAQFAYVILSETLVYKILGHLPYGEGARYTFRGRNSVKLSVRTHTEEKGLL